MSSQAITENDLKAILDEVLPAPAKKIVGYGTPVSISSYTSSSNSFECPSDGIIRIDCNYRSNSYVQLYEATSGVIYAQQSATVNANMVGTNAAAIPVFKGSKWYVTLSSNYSNAYFIPFAETETGTDFGISLVPDYSNHIYTLNGFGSYTPSVDCFMVAYIYGKNGNYATITIDGNQAVNTWQESSTMTRIVFTTPVKAGKPIVYSAAAGNPASGALKFYGFY